MPFGLGFFATAGGAAIAAGDYDLLTTTVLGTATASVTFSNLGDYSSTYKHLQIRYTAHSSRASADADPMIIAINGTDQTRTHHLWGNGSSVSSGNATAYSALMAITGNNAASQVFGAGVIDILDAYATKNKTIRTFACAANYSLSLDSALFDSTSSITSIQLRTFSATNFFIGSRFSLFGLKG